MASNITLEVVAQDGARIDYAALRSALTVLDNDDVSQSSPVTPGVPEAGIEAAGDTAEVRVEGYDGEFTKTSQRALKSALEDAPGVDTVTVTGGGYDEGGDEDE